MNENSNGAGNQRNLSRELAVRRLTHLDAVLIERLKEYGKAALGESALDEWMLPVVASCGLLFVGKVGEEIVGTAEIIRCLEGRDLYLEGFYVREEYRRRGYGKALLNSIKELLAKEGYERLLVTLAPENEAGLRLYQATGFTEIDYLPDHYGTGRHRLLLQQILTAPEKNQS